jgi:hypothetical protein
MSQHAIIRGEVCFRAGDGVLMPVPDGDVDIETGRRQRHAVLDGRRGQCTGSAAITRDEYERYRKEGKIRRTGSSPWKRAPSSKRSCCCSRWAASLAVRPWRLLRPYGGESAAAGDRLSSPA